jgi:hypothetical protein
MQNLDWFSIGHIENAENIVVDTNRPINERQRVVASILEPGPPNILKT